MNKLNERLLKACGFVSATNDKYIKVSHWSPDGKTPYWKNPKGRWGNPPDFTTNLNYCFKWIVPILNTEWKLGKYKGDVCYFCFVGHIDVYADTPALALCLATDKYLKETLNV